MASLLGAGKFAGPGGAIRGMEIAQAHAAAALGRRPEAAPSGRGGKGHVPGKAGEERGRGGEPSGPEALAENVGRRAARERV